MAGCTCSQRNGSGIPILKSRIAYHLAAVVVLTALRASPAATDEDAKKLEHRINAVENALTTYRPRGGAAAAAEQANIPFIRVRIEKARLLLSQSSLLYYYQSDLERAVEEAEIGLKLLQQGREVYGESPGLQERAYTCDTDGSAQPYYVVVPRSYSQKRLWPLVVLLHGYDPSITKANPWIPSGDILALAEKYGYMLVVPYGRRNTDFVGIGELDVMRVIDEVTARFHVDKNRIYLAGISMGGYGAYVIGLHYPDRFAAVATVSGRTDHYYWQHLRRSGVAGFKRLLIDADNPIDLAGNAINVPFYIQQGRQDTLVSIEHSRRMDKLLDKLDCLHRFDELPDEGHYVYFDADCYERMFDFFQQHQRPAAPPTVDYTTFLLRYHRAYWVDITELEHFGKRAHIRAEVEDDNRVVVQAENIAAFTLTAVPELFEFDRDVEVVVGGKRIVKQRAKPNQRIPVRLTDRQLPPLHKSARLTGPVREAYLHPFVIVSGSEDETKPSSPALQLATEWYQFADGIPPLMPASKVSPGVMAERNLILVGGPDENAVTARLSKNLPIKLTKDTVVIGDQTIKLSEDRGLLVTYPNPLYPRRLLVIQSGLPWGGNLPINHKLDLLPDFIVYTDKEGYDGANKFVCAGFFDEQWQLCNELTWWNRDGKLEANAELPGASGPPYSRRNPSGIYGSSAGDYGSSLPTSP